MAAVNRHRKPNIYGYRVSSLGKKVPWPGAQLQNLLNLNNKSYRPIKKKILSLVVKHLDLNFTGNNQQESLRAIEKELSEQHPEIFAAEESQKRLYFVTRLVLHLHTTRRWKSNNAKKKENQQPPEAPTPNSSIITPNQKKNHQQQRQVATQDLALESASRALPRPEESTTTHDPNQYRDIRNFLETATPPMTHLMDAFIDFGCINADFLLTISSWSSEKIRDVLDQLSLGPGRQITEMDKFILEHHFKEYFTKLGKT